MEMKSKKEYTAISRSTTELLTQNGSANPGLNRGPTETCVRASYSNRSHSKWEKCVIYSLQHSGARFSGRLFLLSAYPLNSGGADVTTKL